MPVAEQSESGLHDEESPSALYVDSDEEWGDNLDFFQNELTYNKELYDHTAQSAHSFTANDKEIVYFEKFLNE